MLQARLCGRSLSRFPRSCRCPPHRRRFSCEPLPVDESYTSTHVAADGRVFQYATVVKSMRKGESALPAWAYACSLVGANTPTLGVTFVSKPTDSALAVVREFANQFSHGTEPAAAAHPSEYNSQHHSYCSTANGVPVAADYNLNGNESLKFTQTLQNCKGKVPNYCSGIESKVTPIPPLIGCIVTDHDSMTLTTSILSAATEGFGEDLIWMDDSDQKGDDPKRGGVKDDGQRDDKTGPAGGSSDAPNARIDNFHDATNVQLKCHSVEQATSKEKITEDEGTFSDWEELIREYDHLKIESEISDDAKGDNKDESLPVSEMEVDFIVQEEFPEQGSKRDIKERLARFWNHFAQSSPASLFQKSAERDMKALSYSKAFIEIVLKQHEVTRSHVRVQKEKPSSAVQIHGTTAQGREPPLKCRYGEVLVPQVGCSLGASKQINATNDFSHQVVDDAVGVDKKTIHDCESHIGKDDETYQMILCVGYMPGVKASGFYTRTTGLPWLPDLSNAVTVNNPHMLLLGAPGFNLLELTDRLVHMFPSSCRAGASLLEVPSPTNERIVLDKATKLFYGTKHASIGAVGLAISSAISSSEVAGSVPVDAFSEFVRMSLGMPFGSCWNTFLDDTVCKSLFLPQNEKIEWLDTFQKAYTVDSGSVLDKMYAKIHNKFDLSSFTGSVDMMHDEKVLTIDGQRDNLKWTDMALTSSERDRTETSDSEQTIQPVEPESLSIISVNKVLFPGFFIPLFIDNPCDRLMVKHCMEQKRPFGVSSLSTEASLDPIDCKGIVGTIADMKVSLFGRDCKSYIIAHGVRRFRVLNRIHLQPGTFGQLVGQVELFEDIEFGKDHEKEEVVELARQALDLCQHLFPSAAAMLGPGRSFQDPIIASFAVSHILPVSAVVKKRWLGMVNTKYRLKEQITFLNA